ncbi:MAG: iron-containing alcohol dehydrogenase [Eggerthella lenta]
MWASSMALNTVLDAGTVHGCACHMMEHELSAYYDITHGHGLAILAPRWLKTSWTADASANIVWALRCSVEGSFA